MPFLDDDFLLRCETARRLYRDYAARQPLLDFHCHLTVIDIAVNRRFDDLHDIWLAGDHYKWRAMRAAGVDERFCTGDASPYDKFLAWAATVPRTLRNPLYHWTHLELRRYFGITDLLDAATAPGIWERANERLGDESLTPRGILRRFGVRVLCTTDDPADSLEHHAAIRNGGGDIRVLPTFRPDAALEVDAPDRFSAWVARLSQSSDVNIDSFDDLVEALMKRHDAFHDAGCRLSDHGIPYCYDQPCGDREAERIFVNALQGQAATAREHEGFAAQLMLLFGHLDARRGWTSQLHLGARRRVNSRMTKTAGRDTGYDSIGDWPHGDRLAAFLDRLETEQALPKTVIYNSNPADNYAMATMVGNFQDGKTAGRIQLGAAWWFLDQKAGIEAQLDALSQTGLLSQFVGMVTDSRSFMSFPRHEYFRRILCDLLGGEMERGELPADIELVGRLVADVCFGNAQRYLGLDAGDTGPV